MKLSALELQTVRREFPVFAQTHHTVFLDNAGGSQVLQCVADRIHSYLLTTSVQLGASYSTSQQASERVVQARKAIAELINAPDDREVVMGGSTTGLMFLLIQAILPSIQPGDEIIVTNTDHEANIGAWKRLQAAGAIVKVWEVNRHSLELDLSTLQNLLSERTKWVAMTHASNVLGTINPVTEVAGLVHSFGARLCVDGVAYAPHRLVDVQASGVDVYVFSFYKVFGPHYAVLWGHFELLRSLSGLNHFFIEPEDLPYKLQPGNVNFELSYGCAGIRDYLIKMGQSFGGVGSTRELMQLAFDRFETHENALTEQLLSFLRSRPQVRIIGLSEVEQGKAKRVPTVSFVVGGSSSESIVRHIDQFGIGIRFGDFYAKHLIQTLDLEKHGGVVRVSIAHYNSSDEIDRLVHHLSEII